MVEVEIVYLSAIDVIDFIASKVNGLVSKVVEVDY